MQMLIQRLGRGVCVSEQLLGGLTLLAPNPVLSEGPDQGGSDPIQIGWSPGEGAPTCHNVSPPAFCSADLLTKSSRL